MRFLRCLQTAVLAGLAMAVLTARAAGAPPMAGRNDCQFMPPAEWTDSALTWDGPCKEGKAHGLGVLRAYKKGATTLLFFGNLEQGELRLGVIEGSDGYIPGPFHEGKPLPDAEHNAIIAAFRVASEAAKAYSQRLTQAGNKSSAAFYAKKAKELEQQMD